LINVKLSPINEDILDIVYYIIDGNSVQELEKAQVINDLGVISDSSHSVIIYHKKGIRLIA